LEIENKHDETVTSIKKKELEARLKKVFSLKKIEYTYTPITYKHELGAKVKEEGCFGYHEVESILVDGKSINIAWIPHVEDITPAFFEELVTRIEKAVGEIKKTKPKTKKKKPKKSVVDNIKESLTNLL
jgi:hypothetical protein